NMVKEPTLVFQSVAYCPPRLPVQIVDDPLCSHDQIGMEMLGQLAQGPGRGAALVNNFISDTVDAIELPLDSPRRVPQVFGERRWPIEDSRLDPERPMADRRMARGEREELRQVRGPRLQE